MWITYDHVPRGQEHLHRRDVDVCSHEFEPDENGQWPDYCAICNKFYMAEDDIKIAQLINNQSKVNGP